MVTQAEAGLKIDNLIQQAGKQAIKSADTNASPAFPDKSTWAQLSEK